MDARVTRRMTEAPRLLALDFDGVLCDGRPEYFETACRAYAAVWPGADVARAGAMAAAFSAARPLVETGWEMPLLLHALVSGVSEADLVDRGAWRVTARRLLERAPTDTAGLARALNAARDAWFAADPKDWLRHHAFYPGVGARVVQALEAGVDVAIVTTKAERFARALLSAQDTRLAAVPIIGREPERAVPKAETLLRLARDRGLPAGGDGLWFVEDMLETLTLVRATAGLGKARLFLAGWGYNTLEQRATAGRHGDASLLSLRDFAGAFAEWPR
jgi:phosphoglycolate phosphatase-like HAD superfamily hydrolase